MVEASETPSSANKSSRTLIMVVAGLWIGVCLGAAVIAGLAYAGVITNPFSGQAQAGSQEMPLAKEESGTPAADFDLAAPDGSRVKLSDYKGKVVAFNYWATWCGPCIEEMPMFQRYQEQYPNFVMIGIDEEETAEQVNNFLNKYKFTYQMALDPDAKAAAAYRVMLLPTTIFVDEKGEIRFRHYGIMSEDQLRYYLETLGVIQE